MIEDALRTKYIGADRQGEEWALCFEAVELLDALTIEEAP